MPQKVLKYIGYWLTLDQTQRLINAPDITTLKGIQDRAIFAILIGCGLRRSELANQICEDVYQREGRLLLRK
ncbi:MAG: hypothetical protein JEZ06_16820 [Anaerolineaceae bacterium]|nr:hypothetical protein [Anaerolineaceae bacterium]